MTILIPTISRIRDRANMIACGSNESQLFRAVLLYINDNDGHFPAPAQVGDEPGGYSKTCAFAMDAGAVLNFQFGTLWPYLGPSISARQKVVWCPSDSNEHSRYSGMNNARNFSYSMNANVRLDYPPVEKQNTLKYIQVLQPALRVMIYEEFGPNDFCCYGPGDSDDWLGGRHGGQASSLYANMSAYQTAMYNSIGRANVCYFDGHIAPMTVKEFFTNTAHYAPLTQ